LALIKAITEKDPEKAEQAARIHLRRSREKPSKEIEEES
jgi:DNA-binding GntR family transcriptional regulator